MLKMYAISLFFLCNGIHAQYKPVYEDLFGPYQFLNLQLSPQAIALLQTADQEKSKITQDYKIIRQDFYTQATPWYHRLLNMIITPQLAKLSLSGDKIVTLTQKYLPDIKSDPVLVECILSLLDHETQSRFANYTFYQACLTDNPKIADILLRMNFDIKTKHTSYLHTAVHSGSLQCTQTILEHGIDPNRLARRHEDIERKILTPLEIATNYNNRAMQQLLLNKGAKPTNTMVLIEAIKE